MSLVEGRRLTIGDAPFSVSATASSGLPVSFSASGSCTVAGTLVTVTSAGSCTITAAQGGDGNYNPAPSVSRSFSIPAATLTATVQPATRQYSDPNPTFQVSFSGFVNGDDVSVISGSPSSPAGQYPITCDLSGTSR